MAPPTHLTSPQKVLIWSAQDLCHECLEGTFPASRVVPDAVEPRRPGFAPPEHPTILDPPPVVIVRPRDLDAMMESDQPLPVQNHTILPIPSRGFHPDAMLRVHILIAGSSWEGAFLQWWFGARQRSLLTRDWKPALKEILTDKHLKSMIRIHVLPKGPKHDDDPFSASELKRITGAPLGHDYLKKLQNEILSSLDEQKNADAHAAAAADASPVVPAPSSGDDPHQAPAPPRSAAPSTPPRSTAPSTDVDGPVAAAQVGDAPSPPQPQPEPTRPKPTQPPARPPARPQPEQDQPQALDLFAPRPAKDGESDQSGRPPSR